MAKTALVLGGGMLRVSWSTGMIAAWAQAPA